ncbi:hypothetical protein [Sphingobacterium sp. SGR-19]|uniref:hypothetical protein n=1 Tax=Sphingobacterium sp. SGR-19 TaxID=2710886 RepID=UPI0013ECF97D|nr:hypothetical protein [Sphingobacterium sp. SGR-19]NGM67264.1 hypothetical protein [Sphingobacterium sp. SGR-19]
MKRRFIKVFVMLIGLLTLGVLSGAQAGEQRDSIPESAFSHGYPYPFALGVHMGTTGVGLHLYQPLGPKFGLRVGASYMPLNTQIGGTYNNYATRSDVKAKSGNVSLTLGWTPFAQGSGFFRSFNVQAGGAYFYKLDGELTTRLRDPYKFGEINVHPDHVGTITTDVEWKKTVNPYAGIGWSNIVIDSRFSMHIDLGCYYLSKPSVSIHATGLLEENVSNAATIERNIENYRYLPRLEFGFSYRFW